MSHIFVGSLKPTLGSLHNFGRSDADVKLWKIMICSKCICIFMPNSWSKSWIVSTQGGEVLAERGSSEAVLHISVRANPSAKLRWFRNGRELSKFNPHFIMTENYLKISEISDFDNGTYVVRADNGIQSGSSHPK